MLRITLNLLKSKAQELLAGEQAGFIAGWCTVEQIFNCKMNFENTCNTNVVSFTASLTLRKLSSACDMIDNGML
ncbi:hypothetical protein DPMN_011492 [Dreissena polymorpha]|uniref:Uncharacterized protein n=1 Tax=Dreissena polymorpha TaxID=45954 RepID=A0A9D4S1W7_DREPO|nr:hypothetical protein DPMN_011492 [Dreissena polymorpha]